MVTRIGFVLSIVLLVVLFGCDSLPLPGVEPTPSRQISYDGPATLTVKTGQVLPGTTIGYQGKAPDGRAILSINGAQALKSTADSVNWTGALVLFSLIDLKLRVVTFDEKSMTLAGTIHLVVQEPNPTPGNLSTNVLADYTIPVTYTVDTNTTIPGTNVSYVGAKTGSAEFTNLDQFPYRERFDSVVWQGHLRDRIALRLDLRVLDFNEDRTVLGGTARIAFEQ